MYHEKFRKEINVKRRAQYASPHPAYSGSSPTVHVPVPIHHVPIPAPAPIVEEQDDEQDEPPHTTPFQKFIIPKRSSKDKTIKTFADIDSALREYEKKQYCQKHITDQSLYNVSFYENIRIEKKYGDCKNFGR